MPTSCLTRCIAIAATAGVALAQTNWALTDTPRWFHAAVADFSGRTFVFGGHGTTGTPLDLCESWDGSNWQVHDVALRPPPRHSHSMAFDLARGVVVLFGGDLAAVGTLLANDTWEWNGSVWNQVATGPLTPVARSEAAMAYDPWNGGVLLFGGWRGFGELGDAWRWNGSAWTLIATAIAPAPRSGHAMVTELTRGTVVLFGGTGATGFLADTWIWTGWAWTPVAPSTTPPARRNHSMCFDMGRARTIVCGGFDGTSARNDVWAWDGAAWSNITPPGNAPPPFRGATLTFDLGSGDCVLDSGLEPSDIGATSSLGRGIWNLGPTGWTTATKVLPRQNSPAAYDSTRHVAIMFGGSVDLGTLGDTVLWDHGLSTTAQPANVPPPRQAHTLVLDSARQRAVMFGGIDTLPMADTWEWNGTTWTQQFPSTSPPARFGGHAVFDEARQRTVLYGGDNGSFQMMFDTWTWDGTNWTSAVPLFSTAPPSRRRAAFAYDRHRQKAVLFGGGNGVRRLNDTWEWNGAAWTSVPAGGPAARQQALMVYDDARRRCVLQGGYSGVNQLTDTWEWDGSTWIQRSTGPAPVAAGTAFFDPTSRRIVVLGSAWSPNPLDASQVNLESSTWTYGPVNPAAVAEYGSGCPGSAGTPRLLGDDGALPWLGDTFVLAIDSVPTTTTGLLAIGFSDTSFAGAPLPLSLAPLGLTNCSLFTSIDLWLPFVASGNRATVALVVPDNGALVGLQFFAQATVNDAVNPAGLVVSNAIAATIGAR